MQALRNWLLRVLAGNSPIMLNVCVKGLVSVDATQTGGFFHGCTFTD